MISVKNISKSFGTVCALENVDFSISQGEVVALLGPNGAGKTTLMRILTGFLLPDKGQADIFGYDILDNRIKALSKIGYMPENCPLYQEMTVYRFLKFCADIRKMPAKDFKKNFKETVKQLEIEEVIGRRIETLSKGFKRRVGIAGCIIHKPEVLILDEPTEGLDPNQKAVIRSFIKNYGKKGIVLISTHIMEEVEAVSNRVLLIDKGRLIKDSTSAEIKKLSPDKDMSAAFQMLTSGTRKGKYS